MNEQLHISPPAPVQRALDALTDAGYAAYIVGGCVRDAMRGTVPHDWDCTTSARPEQIEQCFRGFHVIETGMQHGTVTAVIDKMPIEITTYRIDGAYADHRRPDSVTFTDRLTDDLARRDFTVNAMAYHPAQGLIDPYHGADDLAAGIIRCVGDPAARFEEDGLRILRAMRFASVLDFDIAPETAAAIHEKRGLLTCISAERIYAELTKLLCGKRVLPVLEEFADVLFTVLPELAPMYQFDQQTHWHCYDVYMHTLHVIEGCPPDPILRWAALLHDSGKPHTFTKDERGGHFYGHAKVSVQIAERALKALKSDRKTLDRVMLLVEHHDLVWGNSEKQVARVVRRFDMEIAEQILALHRADVGAQAYEIREAQQAEADEIAEKLAALKAADACMSLKKLALTGSDLLRAGFPQGKAIGETLNALLDQVIDGTLPNEHDALMKAAQSMLQTSGTE